MAEGGLNLVTDVIIIIELLHGCLFQAEACSPVSVMSCSFLQEESVGRVQFSSTQEKLELTHHKVVPSNMLYSHKGLVSIAFEPSIALKSVERSLGQVCFMFHFLLFYG